MVRSEPGGLMDPTGPLLIASPDLEVRTRRSGSTLSIHLCGELDLATHQRLLRSLRSVRLDELETLSLELAGLTFCDVRGLCHLLVLARDARSSGSDVVAHDAPATVRKMTHLLGCEPLLRFM